MDNGQGVNRPENKEHEQHMQDEVNKLRKKAGQSVSGTFVKEANSCKYNLDFVFEYQPASDEQIEQYQEIRVAAKHFARTIFKNTPPCADQSAAFRKVREAVMTANAAIALHGHV